MAQRSRKIPRVSVLGTSDLRFELKEEDWQRLQDAYGEELSIEVRDAVGSELRLLLLLWKAEQKAEPFEHTEKIFLGAKTAAENFNEALIALTELSDSARYCWDLITDNLAQSGGKKSLLPFIQLVASFRTACDEALTELNTAPSSPSFQKGECWKVFIPRLTEIFRKAGLPTGASNDGLTESRFVKLVWELQKRFPADCRLSAASKEALAKAINARRSPGRKNSKLASE